MKFLMRLSFLGLLVFVFLFSNNLLSQQNSGEEVIPSEKNPAIAFGCSFLVPGMGQMYNEEVVSGLVLFGGSVVGGTFLVLAQGEDVPEMSLLGLGLLTFCSVYSIIDAPLTAQKMTNERRRILALKTKSLGSIYYYEDSKISLSAKPYFSSQSSGLRLKIEF
jgi:hypothetical protein